MKCERSNLFLAAALSLAAISFSGQHAQAADRIWSNTTGTWDTVTTNWSGSAFTDGDNAIFSSAAANNNLTLGASVNPLNLRSNGADTPATTTITGAAGFTLSLGSAAAGTGNVTAFDGTSAYEQSLTYKLSGTGSAFALAAGSGTTGTPTVWNLASGKNFNIEPGANGQIFDLNGNTVNLTGAGTVQLAAGGITLTSTGTTGVINVNTGILRFNSGTSRNISVDDTVAVNVASGAKLVVAYNSGTGSTYSQALTLNGGTLEKADASAHTADFGGTIALGTGGGIIRNPGGSTWKIGSAISGSTTLTFNAGNIQLNGTSSYTGNTSITAGTVYFANANTLSGGTFTVSGGMLQLGHGSALGTDTVLVDGGGASVSVNANLTVNNALTLKRGATSRAILTLGAGSNWSGGITLDNTNVTNNNYGYGNSGRTDAATASIVSGNVGHSVLGVPSVTSPTFVLRGSNFGKVTGSIALSTGYLMLGDASKWEFSNASNTWGTLDINNASAIATVGATNTLSPGGVVTSIAGGILRLNDQAAANAYSQTIAGLSSNVNVGLITGSSTLTFKHPLNPSIASDVTYSYQWSSDLGEWKASGLSNIGSTTATINAGAAVADVVTVTTTISAGPATKLFVRIVANEAPWWPFAAYAAPSGIGGPPPNFETNTASAHSYSLPL